MLRWRRRADPAEPERGPTDQGGGLTIADRERIRRIEIRTRRLASAVLGGDYRSVFRGTGIEFAEAREYVPGDDVRFIDWNVTARMGVPWVKEYVEERELSVICAVDISDSQLVAHRTDGRLGAAAELTALLGFTAAQHHDRVGLLTFAGEVERFVPPKRGVNHVLRLVRDVLRHPKPTSGTRIAAACDYLSRALRRRSVVFLISDFFDTGYVDSLRTLGRRHDVIALVLVDPTDLALPDLGIVRFAGAEGEPGQLVDTSSGALRARYAQVAAERAAERRRTLAAAGVDEVEIHLDGDLVAPIARFFRTRAMRR
ncbi:MAG: DUF58 domain-containing protein [Chloroflexi bacterium]|nr:DUF58 domain-containing protein [Chloroflexota bacterium]MDA1146789.1 DUF58 domain-containing protein [Chloroflexota bacterium]MQC82404.1 DUF58 domain-containing protein [Chloroflexota bacterium]